MYSAVAFKIWVLEALWKEAFPKGRILVRIGSVFSKSFSCKHGNVEQEMCHERSDTLGLKSLGNCVLVFLENCVWVTET